MEQKTNKTVYINSSRNAAISPILTDGSGLKSLPYHRRTRRPNISPTLTGGRILAPPNNS